MNFDFFDKIYVLNLPSATERLALINEEIEKMGNPSNLEIYFCVDSSSSSLYTKDYNAFNDRYNIVKEAKLNGYNNILLMEDDFLLEPDASLNLELCLNSLPPDWDLFYLTGIPNMGLVKYEEFKKGKRKIFTNIGTSYSDILLELDESDPSFIDPVFPSEAEFFQNYNFYEKINSNLVKVNKGGSVGFLQAVAINSSFYDRFIEKFESFSTSRGFEDIDSWLASIQYYGQVNTYFACPVIGLHRPIISCRTGLYFNKDVREDSLYNALLNI